MYPFDYNKKKNSDKNTPKKDLINFETVGNLVK
jgi:hypothetical protein